MPTNSCSECGQKVVVRQGKSTAMCRKCRASKRMKTCAGCGIDFNASRKNASVQKYCSYECAMKTRIKPRPLKVVKAKPSTVTTLVQCHWCNFLHASKTKYCSESCKVEANSEASRLMRGPIRAAVEDRDFEALVIELKVRSSITESGCWLWPTVNSKGYPVSGAIKRLHRSVIECQLGASLGSQHAHHKCGNAACVNPEHLQPVTHRENIAEMMARQSYLARIEELECRVRELSPKDSLLSVVSHWSK